jgi:glycosyltransferase involved in cell wall biosynthesis
LSRTLPAVQATPRVSVVLPVWNGERFLAEAVESVLSQTLHRFELLLVDDGSTDATAEMSSDYARRDRRVQVIRLQRSGIAHALNAGIAAARGRYVARMDADDISHPSRLQKQLAHLDANPRCVAVGSAVYVMDERGGHVGTSRYPEEHAEITQTLMDGRSNAMAHPTVMARRKALVAVGGYRHDSVPSEDLDLWFRLSRIGTLANMREQLLRYRRHANAVSICERERQWIVGMGIVNEARGKEGLHPLEPRAPRASGSRVAAYHFECARIALMTGPRTAAIRHAFSSVAADPSWPEPYVALAACAFPKWSLRALARLTAPFRSPFV